MSSGLKQKYSDWHNIARLPIPALCFFLVCLSIFSSVSLAKDKMDPEVEKKEPPKRVLIDAKTPKDGVSKGYYEPLDDNQKASTDPNTVAVAVAVEPEPIIIRVTGYGAFNTKKKKQNPQKRLMAIRASKLDAYRSLAERVYGYSVSGESSVNNFALDQDHFKASVNSVVRGAKVVSISENPKTGIETVLELELPGNFQSCLNRVNNFRYRADCLRPITHTDQQTAARLHSELPKKDKSMRTLYHLK